MADTLLPQRRTCTVKELAEIFGVGERTIYDHLDGETIELGEKTINVVRVGRRVVIPLSEVERVLGESA
jgi:excisionase family DNA binding protein